MIGPEPAAARRMAGSCFCISSLIAVPREKLAQSLGREWAGREERERERGGRAPKRKGARGPSALCLAGGARLERPPEDAVASIGARWERMAGSWRAQLLLERGAELVQSCFFDAAAFRVFARTRH
jgi:hypothetical protein